MGIWQGIWHMDISHMALLYYCIGDAQQTWCRNASLPPARPQCHLQHCEAVKRFQLDQAMLPPCCSGSVQGTALGVVDIIGEELDAWRGQGGGGGQWSGKE